MLPSLHGLRRPVTRLLALLLALLLPAVGQPARAAFPTLDPAQLEWLGQRIFQNECAGRPACLTAWNEGEDFPSLGIGHFIWYRAGQEEIFQESFPALLRFMAEAGARPPAWLEHQGFDAPWRDRDAFLAALDGPELTALRAFLHEHMALQTAFIVQRFEASADALLAGVPRDERRRLEARLQAVAQARPPRGLYALIDYVHFKGDGLAPAERYQGQGWGLLQVLRAMADEGEPLAAFVAAAREVLDRRVRNAPPERQESRWLEGWHRRLGTYLPAAP